MGLGVPQPGEIVANKYEVVRFLGKGGMGLVVEARHKRLDQRVAVKFLLPEATDCPESLARFDREARASARLKSAHAVRVFDVDCTPEGVPYIVMEYLEGNDLGAELRARTTLPIAEAVDWTLQACAAISEAHTRGIIHRDIKPSNLFICKDRHGFPQALKVMDFGVSKVLEGGMELTTTDTTIGTPSYMAPEQLMSSKSCDHRVDVWSLGVVLYRMLSGTLPFSAPSATALAAKVATSPPTPLANVVPNLPPDLLAAVMRSLERDPARRTPDVVTLARDLQRFAGPHGVPVAQGSTPPVGRLSGGSFPPALPEASLPALPDAPTIQADSGPTVRGWTRRTPQVSDRSTKFMILASVAGLSGLVLGAVGLLRGAAVAPASATPPPPTTMTAPVIVPPAPQAAPSATASEPSPSATSSAPPTSAAPTTSAGPAPAPTAQNQGRPDTKPANSTSSPPTNNGARRTASPTTRPVRPPTTPPPPEPAKDLPLHL